MSITTKSRSGEKGFTLVELSIVMIIIGLLIGGILKGQELIANARLAAAVSKIKAIDAALNTFRDTYAALPGDLTTPSARLPNCDAATICGATAGNGNSQIGADTGPGTVVNESNENIAVWAELAAADMIGGVQNAADGANVTGGVTVPNADVPGQVYIGYSNGVAAMTGYNGPASSVRAGHYLLIHNGVTGGAANTTAAAAATTSITPSQANRIDIKLDDGAPNTGSALAMGPVAAAAVPPAAAIPGCASSNNVAGTYVTSNQGIGCGIYVRIQQ